MTFDRGATRRKLDRWDRIKFLVILGVFIVIVLWTKVSAPFVTVGDALADMSRETLGGILLILFMLEVLRQIHYLMSERSSAYHLFWADKVFGGAERQITKRTKPWTRFRVGRLFRRFLIVFIYGTIITLFVSDINNPIQAIVETPRLISQFLFFIVYGIFIMTIVVGQFAMIFWFLSRGGVDVVLPEEIETRYTDVWGQDHVLDLVKENVGFLEKPDEIEAKGGYIPGGMLLWGPPGTGKTLIAQATAGEVGRPFVFIEPGAFINMFMGVGILKVKSLFRKLRKLSLRHGGVIAFFDEADALGSRGGSVGQGEGPGQPMEDRQALTGSCNGYHYLSEISRGHVYENVMASSDAFSAPAGKPGLVDRIMMGMGGGGGGMGTLQALLGEMSGLQKPRGLFNKLRKAMGLRTRPAPKYRIFIMMATNMPNALDEAMLRPGRIDRIYKVGYPSKQGRLETFKGYLDKVKHTVSDEQIEDLAVKTPYYSGAKIKDVINEALIHAIRDDRTIISYDDIWKAKALKELGPAEDAGYIEREQHAVAVHEACHAVVGHLVKKHMVIDLATIERRSNTLGMVRSLQMEDRYTQWRSEFEADIMTSVASLAGERMFFGGDNSSGVSADLRNATTLASYMVGVFGMDETILSLAAMGMARFGTPDPSPDILKKMPREVEAVLQRLFDRTQALLDEYQDAVLAVAAALEEKKTISGDEIAEILGTEPGILADDHGEGWTAIDPKRAQIAVGNLDPNGEVIEDDSDNGEVLADIIEAVGETPSDNGEVAEAETVEASDPEEGR